MKGKILVKVEVPENVDRLIREFCTLDGSDVTEFYQEKLLDNLQAFFNAGDLFDLKGLARIHGLHEAFDNLDRSMYGKGGDLNE